MDAEIWDASVQQSGEEIAMPGSARAIDRSEFRGPIDTFVFRIRNMAADAQEELATLVKELVAAMHEMADKKGQEDVSRQTAGFRRWLLGNLWAMLVLGGSTLLWVGTLQNRMAVLEAHDAAAARAAEQLTRVDERFQSFQAEMRRTLDRIEQQVDGPRKR